MSSDRVTPSGPGTSQEERAVVTSVIVVLTSALVLLGLLTFFGISEYRRLGGAGPFVAHLPGWVLRPFVRSVPSRRPDTVAVSVPRFTVPVDDQLGPYYVDLMGHSPQTLTSLAEPTVLPEEAVRLAAPWTAPAVLYGGTLHVNPVSVAQLGLADHARFVATGDERFLESAQRAGQWLQGAQSADGSLRCHFAFQEMRSGWASGMYQGQAISLWCRLNECSTQPAALAAAELAYRFLVLDVSDGGPLGSFDDGSPIVEEYPGARWTRHVLNGAIFAAWGATDLARTTGHAAAAEMWSRLADALASHLADYDTGRWSTYALPLNGVRKPVGVHYHSLHIAQLRVCAALTADPRWTERADRWEQYMYRWHGQSIGRRQ